MDSVVDRTNPFRDSEILQLVRGCNNRFYVNNRCIVKSLKPLNPQDPALDPGQGDCGYQNWIRPCRAPGSKDSLLRQIFPSAWMDFLLLSVSLTQKVGPEKDDYMGKAFQSVDQGCIFRQDMDPAGSIPNFLLYGFHLFLSLNRICA